LNTLNFGVTPLLFLLILGPLTPIILRFMSDYFFAAKKANKSIRFL